MRVVTTGQQYASIDVRVYDDWMPEANEKFRLKLKKAVNAMIGTEDKTVVQIVNLHEGKAGCTIIRSNRSCSTPELDAQTGA